MSHFAQRSVMVAAGLALLLAVGVRAEAAAPVISGYTTTSGVAITSGPPGTQLVVTGTNFGPSGVGVLRFNGQALSVNAWAATYIRVVVPAQPSYPVSAPFTVTTGGITATGPDFTITGSSPAPPPPPPAPTISGYQDTTGAALTSAPPGTTVVITGANLGSSGSVSFSGLNAPATNWTVTAITVSVPNAPSYPDTGPVTVTTGGQTATGAAFTIVAPPLPPPPPSISGYQDTTGAAITTAPAGATVLVIGANFGSSGTISFSGVTAATSAWSPNSITAIVPAFATYPNTGPVTVTTGGQTATGAAFTVTAPASPPPPPPPPVPAYWKGRLTDVAAEVAAVTHGATQILTNSAGGRPLYLVTYGPKSDLQRQANYDSAVAAGDPNYYAHKTATTPPIVYIVGTPHGAEMEAIVGTVNLIHVMETGQDWRGKAWPRLQANMQRCRVLIVPVSNPDGRARCTYDGFVGQTVQVMNLADNGTHKDGTVWSYPQDKGLHPMQGDVGVLGAYFNDNGINLMQDDFFAPMAAETKALLDVARAEAPDYIINLHSEGGGPETIETPFMPHYLKVVQGQFALQLQQAYQAAGLPTGTPPPITEDGDTYPGPSFNLTSALHHVCGGCSMLYEGPHGLTGAGFTQATYDQILDMWMMLFDQLFAFAVQTPHPGR